MMSQPSSPSHSRSGSPSRILQSTNLIQQHNSQQPPPPQHRNSLQRNIRATRRPSVDTTPPPQIQQNVVGVGQNEMIMQHQNIKYDDVSIYHTSVDYVIYKYKHAKS